MYSVGLPYPLHSTSNNLLFLSPGETSSPFLLKGPPFSHIDSPTLDFRYLNWQVNESVLLEQTESDYL